jgi:hypothetical protein
VDFDAAPGRPDLARWEVLAPRITVSSSAMQGAHFTTAATNAEDIKATYASILTRPTPRSHRTALAVIARSRRQTPILSISNQPDLQFPGRRASASCRQGSSRQAIPSTASPSGAVRWLFGWPDETRLRLRRLRTGAHRVHHGARSYGQVLKLLRGEIDMLQNDRRLEPVRYLAAQTRSRS